MPGGNGVELDTALIADLRPIWVFPWPVCGVRYGKRVEKRKWDGIGGRLGYEGK